MRKIIVANNHLSNIGDAFYQQSIITDLRKIYGDDNVISGDEGSVHLDFLSKYYKKNIFDYSIFSQADWYVLSGPILSSSFGEIYEPLLKKLKENNIKLALISVGGLRYTPEEKEHCRKVLKEYQPYILSTRDNITFSNYKDLACYAYNGVCSAFYSSLQFSGYETFDLKDYVVFAFDQYLEPNIMLIEQDNLAKFDIQFSGKIGLKFSRLDYLKDIFRFYPTCVSGKKIIRLQHDTFGTNPAFIFRRPNTYVSFNLYSYLNLIKNSSLLLATRLHACVAAASYQVPSMLFLKNNPRSALFERLGLSEITEKPITLDRDKIAYEHNLFIQFLKGIE